ncbi:hypothetical protein N8371_01535 [Vicingaceae bacterium]|nr:hypothetical protein [Vicingaceae bacterium]MDC1451086.1 hypothetical protein [Vicingaceae bacterium]
MSKPIYILTSLVALLLSVELFSQETIFEETTTVFKTEQSFGVGTHTNGFQATYRHGKYLDGFSKRIYEIEIANVKDPREIKSIYPFEEDVRGYIFGKLNSFFIIRPSIGNQRVLFPKQSIKGVSITSLFQFGPSIGFAKPVYLNIIQEESITSRIVSKERYDPDKHSTNNIYSRASFFNGFEEIKVFPGLFAKLGLHFDYGDERELIKSAEVGVTIDAYYAKVPILAFNEDRQFYPNLYIAIFIGNRSVD